MPSDFFNSLFKALRGRYLLIFAIALIVVVAFFGSRIPPVFNTLIYIVAIAVIVLDFVQAGLQSLPKLRSPESGQYRDDLKKLRSGAILYINVRGFSLMGYKDQELIVKTLREEVEQFFDFETKGILTDNAFSWKYWLNIVGGDFVLFSAYADIETSQPLHTTLVQSLMFAINLILLAKEKGFEFSIALHWGDDLLVVEMGGRLNLYGNSLHTTRNIITMFAEDSHLLISKEAFDKLERNLLQNKMTGSARSLITVARDSLDRPENAMWLGRAKQVEKNDRYRVVRFTQYDHHGREHTLFNFLIVQENADIRVGNPARPPSRVTIQSYEGNMDRIDEKLIDRLIVAEEVTLVGITHPRLAETLAGAYEERKSFWRKIDIVFPNQANVRRLVGDSPDKISQWENAKKSCQVFFESKGKEVVGRWGCLESEHDLTIIGGRFLGGPRDSIRYAPVLPGSGDSEVPYTEVYRGSHTFDQLSPTFDVVVGSGLSIHEWDFFGKVIEDGRIFVHQGVMNRAKIPEETRSDLCFPVILVMLHVETINGRKSILQERTKFNATSDFGTYSNISGRLSTDDLEIDEGKSASADHFRVDFGTPTFVATREFYHLSGWLPGEPVPDQVWRTCAVRELNEELGLNVDPNRLVEQATYLLPRDNASLFFKIFSLELYRNIKIDEFTLIQQRRPYASLKEHTLSELKTLHKEDKLNRLLQRKFEELFVPIFEKLEIVD